MDFLLGLVMPIALRSMLPKIDVRGASLPEPTESEKLEDICGVNDGTSGLKLGPEVEKLNSLLPGVNAGAVTFILPLELVIEGLLKWLEVADAGVVKAERSPIGG